MPSEYVKKQLLSLEYAIPTQYNKETNTYFIPKYTWPVYHEKCCYFVHFAEQLTDNILLSWNNSSIPSSRFLRIYVTQRQGKMIKVDSVLVDNNNNSIESQMWFGWLNSDYLELISRLS